MTLRASLARRLAGPPPRAGYGAAGPRPAPSWMVPPASMLGREPAEMSPRQAQAWPMEVFDDRATLDMLAPQPRFGESRIDEDASGPRVLIRSPRRPAAVIADGEVETPTLPSVQAPPQAVRYTRTPDPVLQERRQRVRDAERAAEAEAEALAAARAEAVIAAEAERAVQAAALPPEPPLPLWRQPFVVPPGVRFFRSPDRKPAPLPKAALPRGAEAEIVAGDWSDVPDWSDMCSWFDGRDSAALDAWSAIQAEAPPALPSEPLPIPAEVATIVPAMVTAAPPAYGLDRLVCFAPAAVPRPADGQDNALGAVLPAPRDIRRAGLSAMAARAAIRSAGTPQDQTPSHAAEPVLVPVELPVAQVIPFAVPPPMDVLPDEAASPELPAFVPTAIAPRPVLLRNPKPVVVVPQEPEVPAQPVLALVEPVAEVVPEPAPLQAPRAILPEPRQTLIPAGRHVPMSVVENADYELPALELLAEPPATGTEEVDADVLEQNALNLQQTVQDFGVRGDILAVRPGPVVTLYELEPAPGTKSSRVIGLSDDIARSMSAVSARVAVVPGRNVIGIELPNEKRETVYLRELLASEDFGVSKHKLALCLGKNIGGEPIIADLAKMPHLLVAGTTGSGKSVAINTMILSLLYRLKPEECRLIMVDPKMLELSVYDGIPHLLSPVVIDPKKAVIALKWAVREMEERYKKMSKIAVRNIDGYNARMAEARAKGEVITREIHTGFNRETGQPVFETEEMDLSALPYIVIVVDEMADLMMVAGKDIEGAIQRLAQMARAAGIHLIMATQRPSVDVITGTIKANFPTRISFQVTSKIDSRTILGEMGAEQLLGQGDMLFMAGGGRTTRVHGPFCSDSEVESVVAHLKRQGRPSYLDAVTADDGSGDEKPAKGAKADKAAASEAEDVDAPIFDAGAYAGSGGIDPGAELYDQAVQVVMRDRKASTSYIQRRLQIGYNRAASLMERMEIEGIVGPANHAGKREILMESAAGMMHGHMMDDDD
ncbi:DNA translocase FtsK [Methylobacterium sp.]|uniref:DNA translocase FtsK n=1 Tax=Methylobacterium sp. TaxID=409 RepID=UPI0025FBFD03|nr:DNA translocase FtsK [Methylobacterium sp.]